jgi:hypothetical protein
MKKIVVELSTPQELIDAIAIKVKEKQKLLGFSIKTIALESGIDRKSYENFIYKKHITLINLIKLLKTLDMISELTNLSSPLEPKDPIEYKKLEHIRIVNKRRAMSSNKKIFKQSSARSKLKLKLLGKDDD